MSQSTTAGAPDIAARSAGLRTGSAYLESLRDGRAVYVDGERVTDVTRHVAFRRAAGTIASLYDAAADPLAGTTMTFCADGRSSPALRAYQIPRTIADLAAKRVFHERWAEMTFGLMGRTPDHVAGFLCGFAAKPSVFAAGGQGFADNIVRFYEDARDRHLYVSYAIVPPQIDRGKPAHRQADPTLYAGIVGERDGGLVLRGAQQLATGAVLADYVYVSCIHPLQPGDENHAFAVAIPIAAPGVKLYARRPFARAGDSAFDYPLSSRFDESDALLVLDDVFVPWEQVFVHRNLEVCRNQWWRTPAHVYGNFQAQTRYATKLRFLLGLARRMIALTGVDALPPVQSQMGELAAIASIVESMILVQESQAVVDEAGVLWPAKSALYAVMALQSELNGRLLEGIRELTGAAMITLPSSVKDFENPEIAPDIERYIASPGVDSRERVALMKMAWDLLGTEFAGRQQQYEKFYGGASFICQQHMFRSYDFARAGALVDEALRGATDERTSGLDRA